MKDFERVRDIKSAAQWRLFDIPGVHAVGIGEKYVDGKPSGESSILVLVVAKKPLDQLKPEEVIPSEIDGLKTDVIQVPMPRLVMASNPSNITVNQINALSFRLEGEPKPGAGLLVTVEFTVNPVPDVPPSFAIAYETREYDTLESIARGLTDRFNAQGINVTRGGAQLTLTPPAGITIQITNVPEVTAVDDHQYFDDWVRGGIQLAPASAGGDFGTLGCIATTAPTSDYPQGRVVALTNHHVVRPKTTAPTNLVTKRGANAQQIVLASSDGGPITERSVLSVAITPDPTAKTDVDEAEYLTAKGDTPTNVANGIRTILTGLGFTVSAPAPGPNPGDIMIAVTGLRTRAAARGPLLTTDDFAAAIDRNSITYSGTVGGDDDGIFLDIFPGGSVPSFGVFVNPPKDSDGNAMAKKVWQAFNALPAAVKGTVTMDEPHANVITLHNVEVVESRITHDIRIGQPDDSFGSSCCHCCSHRIGRVLDARCDLDVALIQLDPDIKYKPEIQDLHLVAGVESPAQNMTVFKRGRATQRNDAAHGGIIRGTDVSGRVDGTLRFFNNAFLVQSVTNSPFSVPGDSGAAIVNAANKVVGINWGAHGIWAYATPIDLIVAAYPDLALNFAPAPAAGQDPSAVRVVPKPAAHMEAAADPRGMAVPPSLASAPIRDRLLEAEKEIAAMPAGRRYADLIRSHFSEGLKLINGNRKVATVWHRNGGPELLQAIFNVIQRRDQRLPLELQGRPLSECLSRILRVMARYASPRFATDLELHGTRLAGMAGLSYNDVLSTLQSWSEEQ